MARLTAIDPEQASGKTKELFNAVQSKLGVVPNMMRTMGNARAFLEGYLSLSGALGTGKLGLKNSNLIAMAVAESNACNYCLSAHTYLGLNVAKIDEATLTDARDGIAKDAKTQAILQFAKLVVAKHGQLNDADVAEVKAAGVTDGEIAEIIGHVALNIMTNYFNNTAGTVIDFPVVAAHVATF